MRQICNPIIWASVAVLALGVCAAENRSRYL